MYRFIKPKVLRLAVFGIGILMIVYPLVYLYVVPHFSSVPRNDFLPTSKEEQSQSHGEFNFKRIHNPFSFSETEKKTPTEKTRSATDVAIVDSWFNRVGYSTKEFEVYRNYSDSTLESMSNNGDIVALHIMGERKLKEGDIDSAKMYAEKGITYGSLASIKSMGDFSDPSVSMRRLSIEGVKPALIKTLAYYSLLGMRGDPHDAFLFKSTLLDAFKNNYNVASALSVDDEKAIEDQASELYQKYQSERLKLGLGDFENNPPQEVKNFNGG